MNVSPEQALDLFQTPQIKPSPSAKAGVFLSTAGQITLMHGTTGLAGYIWGSGPLVLLVHGWESHTGSMVSVAQALVRGGYSVLAFDAPAHGASPGKKTDLIDYSEAIYNTIRHFGSVHSIIAHSFGAAATAMMLAGHSDVQPERVVLLGSPSRLEDVLKRFVRQLMTSTDEFQAVYWTIENTHKLPVSNFSVEEHAPDMPCPALIVHDHNDDIIPFADGERIAAKWPGASLLATNGLGHRRILHNPTVIAQALAYISAPDLMRA